MKKKIAFCILIVFFICLMSIILGIDIKNYQGDYDSYLWALELGASPEPYFQAFARYTVKFVCLGLSLCACIAILVIVLKSDIGFMKESFLAKHAANKAKREEIRAQEENKRKAARISELEKELNELKKGGE